MLPAVMSYMDMELDSLSSNQIAEVQFQNYAALESWAFGHDGSSLNPGWPPTKLDEIWTSGREISKVQSH